MSDVILTLASWGACFWLGFEIGQGRSEQRRQADIDELERRFKIVDYCKVVDTPRTDRIHVPPH